LFSSTTLGISSEDQTRESLNKLDPNEIDRLLKFGAYDILKNTDDGDQKGLTGIHWICTLLTAFFIDDLTEDIDHILERSAKMTYRGNENGEGKTVANGFV